MRPSLIVTALLLLSSKTNGGNTLRFRIRQSGRRKSLNPAFLGGIECGPDSQAIGIHRNRRQEPAATRSGELLALFGITADLAGALGPGPDGRRSLGRKLNAFSMEIVANGAGLRIGKSLPQSGNSLFDTPLGQCPGFGQISKFIGFLLRGSEKILKSPQHIYTKLLSIHAKPMR